MKLSEVGPTAWDQTAGVAKVARARLKSFLVAMDDIIKTMADAAFYLFLEFEKAKASRPAIRVRRGEER